MKRYSLSDYIVTINIKDIDSNLSQLVGETISIGGEGSYVGSISLKYLNNNGMYNIDADDTGSYVYNRSLNLSGQIDISLNQISPAATKLRTIFNYYLSQDLLNPFTITLSQSNADGTQTKISNMIDCMITSLPEQKYESSAGMQTWSIQCGKLIFVD